MLYRQFGDEKICHGATVDNVVTYVCTKFDNDQLRNEYALADGKSDNKNNTHTKNNDVGDAWGPVPRSKKKAVELACLCVL